MPPVNRNPREVIVKGCKRRTKGSLKTLEVGKKGRSLCWVVAALLVVLLALSGCGNTGSSSGSTPVTEADRSVVEVLRSGPLDFKVFVDDSASRASDPLIEQSMLDVQNAFELTLAVGGSFSAKSIRGDLASVDLVAPALIPAPGGGHDEIERSEIATATRSELEAATQALLGEHPAPGLRGGSDLAYNLRQALSSIDRASDRQTVIMVVTDGVDDSVKGHLGESPKQIAARLSSHLGSAAKGNAAATVVIAGVGMSSEGAPGGAAYRLQSAWEMACERTGARCAVSTEVTAPVLLEAFENA
jgi:hypothetical protein